MTIAKLMAVSVAMALSFVAWVHTPDNVPSSAYVEASHVYDASLCVYSPEIAGPDCGAQGDDNGDGLIMEDESGWDCHTMGNQVCGDVDRERAGR